MPFLETIQRCTVYVAPSAFDIVVATFEIFTFNTFNTKLPEIAKLAFNDFTAAKNMLDLMITGS